MRGDFLIVWFVVCVCGGGLDIYLYVKVEGRSEGNMGGRKEKMIGAVGL